MSSDFHLVVTTDPAERTAEFRLLDGHGRPLASRRTDFRSIDVSARQELFDLRNALRTLGDPGDEAASMARVGVLIAERVLGEEIFLPLWRAESQRTLRVFLPGAGRDGDILTAALARVPWEIARPSPNRPTLGERNLLVRVVHDMAAPPSTPLELAQGEELRVLVVFAEAPLSRPLAERAERRALERLFRQKIYPRRRVVADFVTHGVTRERLAERIASRSGYHMVHWSGHGRLNQLELVRPDRKRDYLSGHELLDLFAAAGGFIPRLVFLSACHSGDILRVESWNDFLAVARGDERGGRGTRDIDVEDPPGFTGTAHALLQRGVPTVVAMRYAVGDDYARELAVEFYDALLAHDTPKSPAAALTMARRSLLDPRRHDPARFHPCDHATPVLYGEELPGPVPPPGRSSALDARSPRLLRVDDLAAAAHEHFVGRTWELDGLGAGFIGSGVGNDTQPVALITGLGGMGKTALAAEAVALWESRFQWVLLYRAPSGGLDFEGILSDVHRKLGAERGRYHAHVQEYPADAVHRPADAEFTGDERLERLVRNLVRALADEPVLLVLDNFETCLKPEPEPAEEGGEPLWACLDPGWDRCLAGLAEELRGTPSRVLLTSRRPLAALAGACHRIPLGPLPAGEAALYLRQHPGLSRMVFGGELEEEALARRLLVASRFHPLLMDRLARLATGGAALRQRLMEALHALEHHGGAASLPELFADGPRSAQELSYLDEALSRSIDALVRNASPDARRLLWVLATANEPVTRVLAESVWDPEPYAHQDLRHLAAEGSLPLELRGVLNSLAPASPHPDPTPLLRSLVAIGLVTERSTGPDDDNPDLLVHELVRERVHAWMGKHPDDRGTLTESAIRLAYAERLAGAYGDLLRTNVSDAIEAGARGLVYCVQAGDHGRMAEFASSLVTGAGDPRLLERLLPHLEAAAARAPDGRARWTFRAYIADTLVGAGRHDECLPFYARAEALARGAAETGERQAWRDVAWITTNWAGALLATGRVEASRQRYRDAIEAATRAGMPPISVLGLEMEMLRNDIVRGEGAEALPRVESLLARLREWWLRDRAGQPVPEAPDPEILARTVVSGLHAATMAYSAAAEWTQALRLLDEIIEVARSQDRSKELVASVQVERARALRNLGHLAEAKTALDAALRVLDHDADARAGALSELASLYHALADVAQAVRQERRALALRENFPATGARAASHHKLAVLLAESGDAPAESARHQLAALLYWLVGEHPDRRVSYTRYAGDLREAGGVLAVPRVAELLADPAFSHLADWLRERVFDLKRLQDVIDTAMDHLRSGVERGPGAADPDPPGGDPTSSSGPAQ